MTPTSCLAAVELVRAQARALTALEGGDPYPCAEIADHIAELARHPDQVVEMATALSTLVVSVLHACTTDADAREALLDQWALHLMTTP
ncbi:hypothetical protein ACFYPC_09645 [Streptomyces sp. NPDC005808]|uniref:hypothetical protein n=1 Tax=Streptomyces sp. NPDC005808 TaxID=3364734 RepID=UPI0036CC33F9